MSVPLVNKIAPVLSRSLVLLPHAQLKTGADVRLGETKTIAPRVFRRTGASHLNRKAKTRPRYFPGGPHCEENLNQHLLERDASRFQVLGLRQIHRKDTLLDSGRNLVGID
jgi:hypothetical protein